MLRHEMVPLRCFVTERGFDEPEPAIGATRDLGEEIGAISIYQVRRLPDSVPDMFAKGGKHRCKGLDMTVPVSNRERIPGQRRSPGDHVRCSLGTASQLHDTLGEQVDIAIDSM